MYIRTFYSYQMIKICYKCILDSLSQRFDISLKAIKQVQRLYLNVSMAMQLYITTFMGTPPSFSAMLSKGDNFRDFLFAYLEDMAFLNLGLLVKEKMCSNGSKFFPL